MASEDVLLHAIEDDVNRGASPRLWRVLADTKVTGTHGTLHGIKVRLSVYEIRSVCNKFRYAMRAALAVLTACEQSASGDARVCIALQPIVALPLERLNVDTTA